MDREGVFVINNNSTNNNNDNNNIDNTAMFFGIRQDGSDC